MHRAGSQLKIVGKLVTSRLNILQPRPPVLHLLRVRLPVHHRQPGLPAGHDGSDRQRLPHRLRHCGEIRGSVPSIQGKVTLYLRQVS